MVGKWMSLTHVVFLVVQKGTFWIQNFPERVLEPEKQLEHNNDIAQNCLVDNSEKQIFVDHKT